MAGCGGKPPVGSGASPCFRPRLRPRLAPAVASATGTETDPTRTDPPLRGATPEIGPVDREEILVENGQFREVNHAQGRVRWVGGWVVILELF